MAQGIREPIRSELLRRGLLDARSPVTADWKLYAQQGERFLLAEEIPPKIGTPGIVYDRRADVVFPESVSALGVVAHGYWEEPTVEPEERRAIEARVRGVRWQAR